MAVYLTGSSDCLTSDNTVVAVIIYYGHVWLYLTGSSDCLTSDSTVVVVQMAVYLTGSSDSDLI